MRFASFISIAAAAALASAGGTLAAQAPAASPTSDPDRALVQKTCSGCHEIGQVTSQHKTAADWGATVDKMIGFGAQISDADYDRIVGYLAAHQGVAAPGGAAQGQHR